MRVPVETIIEINKIDYPAILTYSEDENNFELHSLHLLDKNETDMTFLLSDLDDQAEYLDVAERHRAESIECK